MYTPPIITHEELNYLRYTGRAIHTFGVIYMIDHDNCHDMEGCSGCLGAFPGVGVAIFGFDALACYRVLNTHSLSIIITDCSPANNFILSFLSDSCLVRLFLDFS